MPISATCQLVLWSADDGDRWQSLTVPDVIALSGAGVVPQAADSFDAAETVIHALRTSVGAVGVLLHSGRRTPPVCLNGVPLPAGLHVLRHADRVDVSPRSFWISTVTQVEETTYEPAVHGDDVYCFLTKARLSAGQTIKVCPGPPGTECGVVYTAAAWNLAMGAESSLKCPNCGYRPDQAKWHPPGPRNRKSLDDILHLIGCGNGRATRS
jgi:hypothetical protein